MSYSKEEKKNWKINFDSKIEKAATEIFTDWYSFELESSIEYTHWIDYPKKENRIIPFKIKIFVLNLRPIFRYNSPILTDRKINHFLNKRKIYSKEMGPLIGPIYTEFIGDKTQKFVDLFKEPILKSSVIRAYIKGHPERKNEPLILYYDQNLSLIDGKIIQKKDEVLIRRIKTNYGNIEAKYIQNWHEAFDYTNYYSSSGFYSHPDFRYSDFIILTSSIDKKILSHICKSIIGRNCQKLSDVKFPLIRPMIIHPLHGQIDTEPLHASRSMIEGCEHIPNFTILALDYDIEFEDLNNIFEKNPTQKDKFENQITRQNIIIQRHREEVAEVARKRREEEEAKRKLEEKRRYNIHNTHSKDAKIRFEDNCNYKVSNQNYDNIKFVLSSLFPSFDKDKFIRQKREISNLDSESILKQWKEKTEATKKHEQELIKDIEYWYQTGHKINSPAFNLFKEFSDNRNIFPYRSNWHVYDEETLLAGTVDLATQNEDGSLIIYRLTTKSHIIFNGIPIKNNEEGIKAKTPINHIPNTLYHRLALELNMLKYIIETSYGYKVKELRLGVFNEELNKPYILKIPFYNDEVNDIISIRNDVIY